MWPNFQQWLNPFYLQWLILGRNFLQKGKVDFLIITLNFIIQLVSKNFHENNAVIGIGFGLKHMEF